MKTRDLFQSLISHTHKNTIDNIKSLLDGGFNVVYTTNRAIPKAIKNHKNVRIYADNLDGLTNPVIWSDDILIKSLNSHFGELKKCKSDSMDMAMEMIDVCSNQVKRMADLNHRLYLEIDLLDVKLSEFGLIGRVFRCLKVFKLETKKTDLTNQIKMNTTYMKRSNNTIAEMKSILNTKK